MGNFVFLFSHCVIVNGVERSAICDLQRQAIYLIPNAFANLFSGSNYFNKDEITSALEGDELEILNEYLSFLGQRELAFYCDADEIGNFPALPNELLFPAKISHCVLDITSGFNYFNREFVDQLGKLSCDFVQLRFFGTIALNNLNRTLELVSQSYMKGIEMILNVQQWPGFENEMRLLVANNPKIIQLTVCGTNGNKIIENGFGGMGIVLYENEEIADHRQCGVVDSKYFSINIPTYTESLAHNTCLNRKISIDVNGNIKNCPSMTESFGNIKDTTIEEAINKPGFKKYWNITKDEITKCKDCEFRHVCTDCRAYIENPDDMYSAPLKCGYDPYTCTWEEWSTNPLKEKAIAYYGMQELVKK